MFFHSTKQTTGHLIIFLAAIFFILPKTVSGQILINEIAWMGTKASPTDEWIELYNNSEQIVALDDWVLFENNNKLLIALTGSIAAKTYYLIERTDDSATSAAADLFGSWGGNGLSNDGEKLSLKNAEGKIIDEIDCSAKWIAGQASPDYRTMERTVNGWTNNIRPSGAQDAKGNIIQGTPKSSNSGDTAATPAAPTPMPSISPDVSPPAPIVAASPAIILPPTPTPTPQYSQDIFINEFLPNPPNNGKEWIELLNNGSNPVNLTGWRIDDADNSINPQIIPANTIIAANGYLIFSFDRPTFNNDGDKIRLLQPDGQTIQIVSFAQAEPNQAVAKFGTDWLWTNQPTPGSVNKKSTAENSITTTLSETPANNAQISTPNPNNVIANPSTKTSPIVSAPATTKAAPTKIATIVNNEQTDQINLIASAGAETKKSGLLILTGILIMAAATAIALIIFRRKKIIDTRNSKH